MKSSGLIYSIVILLLLLGLFSGRSTMKNMSKSENLVDLAYFNIEKKYFNQQILLNDLVSKISEDCRGNIDSLIKELLPGISEPKEISNFDFDQFRAAREKQKHIDFIVNNLGLFLSNNCSDLPSDVLLQVECLETEQKLLMRDWEDYNLKVRIHNTYIKKFPRNFYSSFFKFRSKPYYKSL